MATFDQRDQKVIYQYNAAGNINFHAVQNNADFSTELQKLQKELKKAVEEGVLDEEMAVDVESHLKKAAIQTQKSEPDKKTLLDHLLEAQQLIAGVASAAGLIKGFAEAAEVVRRLF
jgi:ribosomal protein S20